MCKYCKMVHSVDYSNFATVGEKDLENEYFNCNGKQENYTVESFLIKPTNKDIKLGLFIWDKEFTPLNIEVKINYCPMCGRKLNGVIK